MIGMNPYNQAAFGFAQAYQMNMQAADRQRRANEPADNAFAEGVSDIESSLTYQPNPQSPAPPTEQYSGVGPDNGIEAGDENGNSLMRAKRKVSKYLNERD